MLTREEVRVVLARLDGIRWMMASLLYGSGSRLMECTRLRVKDVDFEHPQLIVRDGKGGQDRIASLGTPSAEHSTEPLSAPASTTSAAG